MGVLCLAQQQDPVCFNLSGFSSPSQISGQAQICIHNLPARPPTTHTNQTKSGHSGDFVGSFLRKALKMPFGILLTQGRFPPMNSSSNLRTQQLGLWRPAPTACSATHQNKSPAPACHRAVPQTGFACTKFLPMTPLSKLSQKAEKEKQTRLL